MSRSEGTVALIRRGLSSDPIHSCLKSRIPELSKDAGRSEAWTHSGNSRVVDGTCGVCLGVGHSALSARVNSTTHTRLLVLRKTKLTKATLRAHKPPPDVAARFGLSLIGLHSDRTDDAILNQQKSSGVSSTTARITCPIASLSRTAAAPPPPPLPLALDSSAQCVAAAALNSAASARAWRSRLPRASAPTSADGHARGNDARNAAHLAATAYIRAATASECALPVGAGDAPGGTLPTAHAWNQPADTPASGG
eukprot:CAMPEP_0181396582 /NCGR_PEP_ID=MMETSP1106-20121128/28944_1 /TAXON_ID=81844 /ORGANISM="Mantoniella antarctica, Strain SL-175" /LENGTH=252 /DNA_ID=CAMNT_0023518267 /DNA_START=151 /DNA_END=905 /DNA_ORIENTATION=-